MILCPLVLANVVRWWAVAGMPFVSLGWLVALWICWRLVRADWEGGAW